MRKQQNQFAGVPARSPAGSRPVRVAAGFYARVRSFIRELDRGIAVMYGQQPPGQQPRPAELDTLARTGLLQQPYGHHDTRRQ